MTITSDEVRHKLDQLRQRLDQLGAVDLDILAVTKGFGSDAVTAACGAGLRAVGENYAQELHDKADDLATLVEPAPIWHFIGQLQSNKVKLIASHVDTWQSVDRLKVGRQIQSHAPGATVYVQMQPPALDESTPKGGCPPDDVAQLVSELRGLGLAVDGIMAVGVADDPAATTRSFELAVELADDLSLANRSLGMSGDLELAIEAGSTMIRVGTALFGPRTYAR